MYVLSRLIAYNPEEQFLAFDTTPQLALGYHMRSDIAPLEPKLQKVQLGLSFAE